VDRFARNTQFAETLKKTGLQPNIMARYYRPMPFDDFKKPWINIMERLFEVLAETGDDSKLDREASLTYQNRHA